MNVPPIYAHRSPGSVLGLPCGKQKKRNNNIRLGIGRKNHKPAGVRITRGAVQPGRTRRPFGQDLNALGILAAVTDSFLKIGERGRAQSIYLCIITRPLHRQPRRSQAVTMSVTQGSPLLGGRARWGRRLSIDAFAPNSIEPQARACRRRPIDPPYRTRSLSPRVACFSVRTHSASRSVLPSLMLRRSAMIRPKLGRCDVAEKTTERLPNIFPTQQRLPWSQPTMSGGGALCDC